MTVLTGETGAGKTLIVDAIALLLGGRADATIGAARRRARRVVEGRFVGDRHRRCEWILTRVIPASGRARAYVDGRHGRPRPPSAELGGRLVDLHGQHAHQSLLRPAAQRRRARRRRRHRHRRR